MGQIIGHTPQKKILSAVLARKVPHHAFVFHGPCGIGKKSLAASFAWSLVRGHKSNAQWDIPAHLTKESAIMVLSPTMITKKGVTTSSGITVDMVRKFRRKLSRTSQTRPSVLIIDQAQEMTIQAQNALLKIIEEPHGQTSIICVTSEIDKLLPTICSRGMPLSFGVLSAIEMAKLSGVTDAILEVSFGRPAQAIKMIEDFSVYTHAIESLQILKDVRSKPLHEKLEIAAVFAKDHVVAIGTLELWLLRIYNVAHDHKRYDVLLLANRTEVALKELRDRNTNKKLVLENLMLSL